MCAGFEETARERIFVKRNLDTASALCHISAPRDSGFSIRPVILEESTDNVAAAPFLVTGPSVSSALSLSFLPLVSRVGKVKKEKKKKEEK